MANFAVYPRSAQNGDPIVPADGELDVDGDLTVDGSINATGDFDGVSLSLAGAVAVNHNPGEVAVLIVDALNPNQWSTSNENITLTAGDTLVLEGSSNGVSVVDNLDVTGSGLVSCKSVVATEGVRLGAVSGAKTAAYSAAATDHLILADPNGAAGSFAITLPSAAVGAGTEIIVKVISLHATRVVTVIRDGTDTIEGVTAGQTTTTFTTTAALASATFISNGTSKWYLVATQGTVT